MLELLSILYGLHITLLIYLVSYFTAKGIIGKGGLSGIIVAVKFLLYWKLISFGFKHLPAWGILTGLIGSIYLSLPILYWVNKKLSAEK